MDIPRVHEIDTASFTLPWPERSFRFEILENSASRLWVAEIEIDGQDKKIVGILVLWLIIDEAHIGTFAIDPAYRRLKIGQNLLAQALLGALHQGAVLSFLEVRRSNIAAQKLYEQFGYQVTSVRNGYYRDNGEDALLMTLEKLDEQHLKTLLNNCDNTMPHVSDREENGG